MDRPSPYKGTEPYIFISYAHRDSAQVWPIIQRLHNDGYRVWYDEGIDPGTEWDEFIATHIEKCDYFIAFLSTAYLGSENCKDELNYVRDVGKDRLLVYLEDVALPSGMRMRLGRLQAIHWYNYTDTEQAFAKLYETPELSRFLTPPAPKAEPAPQDEPRLKEPALKAEDLFSDFFGRNRSQPKAEPKEAPKPQVPLTPQQHYAQGTALYEQKNYKQAAQAFILAAEGGHVAAQNMLGICLEYGRGVRQDVRAAVVCYRKAAGHGLAAAQFNLGLCLSNGTGIAQDLHAAVVCYRQAAKQGHADAQNSLAVCLANGTGVAADPAQALLWFRKAAEQGNPRALYNLGRRYAAGIDVAKDDATALALLRKAADLGHEQARKLLAEGYHLKEYQ